ncbi:hypothetical protein Tco_1186504 [Tanacetum coccineum]
MLAMFVTGTSQADNTLYKGLIHYRILQGRLQELVLMLDHAGFPSSLRITLSITQIVLWQDLMDYRVGDSLLQLSWINRNLWRISLRYHGKLEEVNIPRSCACLRPYMLYEDAIRYETVVQPPNSEQQRANDYFGNQFPFLLEHIPIATRSEICCEESAMASFDVLCSVRTLGEVRTDNISPSVSS